MACPSQGTEEKHCDACESTLKSGLFCNACSRVQALGERENYFSIFGQNPCYEIDPTAIEAAFDELIVELHPDFHTQGDARDQALSLQHTALLHEAKDALFDPFQRGKYLLRLINPMIGNLTVHPPQSFLIEMFEIQEELDELEQSGGDFGTMEKKIQAEVQEGESQLAQTFELLTQDRENVALTGSVKETLGKLKFLLNLALRLHEIKKKHG